MRPRPRPPSPRRPPRRTARRRALRRRVLCTAVGLAVLGAGVALPAAPAFPQVSTPVYGSVDLETQPDVLRVPFGDQVTLYVRANDEVTYALCEGQGGTHCDVQTVTCGKASESLGLINAQAARARNLLIAEGVRAVTEGHGATRGVDRKDVHLEHLLEKLLDDIGPGLPLRYRFLNPEVDLPDRDWDPVNRVEIDVPSVTDPSRAYRDPALTTELETAAGDRDGDGDTDADDVAGHIAAITTVTAFDALYNVLSNSSPTYFQDRLSAEEARLDTLTTEIGDLTTEIGGLAPGSTERTNKEAERTRKEAERDALLGEVREALRVDPADWPEHVHATLSLLDRYLGRGLGDRPADRHTHGREGRKFFLLEDVPYDLLMMDHQRGGDRYYLWPWSRNHWAGGYLEGFLAFLGLDFPDLSPVRGARLPLRHSPGVGTRPAEEVVVQMVSHCRHWHLSVDPSLRPVGSGPGEATADRVFAPLREPTGPPDDRIFFVDSDYKVLVRDADDGDEYWGFPDAFVGSAPVGSAAGFWGVDTGGYGRQGSWAYWLRFPATSDDDRYIHASHLTLRHDRGPDGVGDTTDDTWELHDESDGSTTAVHTITYNSAGNPVLQATDPWRSATETADVNQTQNVGEWVPGGAIQVTGTRLGERVLEYCLSPRLEGSPGNVCETPWERVTVMVEPDGWVDARAWGNDDGFQLLIDFTSGGHIVLLHEVPGGSVTLNSRTYEVVERVCCLSDEAAAWSFDLELPVMRNDTVRFFEENTTGQSTTLDLIDRYGAPVSAANLTAADQVACAGSRYCTFVRPKAKGVVSTGAFGLGVGEFGTSLQVDVSAPPPHSSTVTSETRTFDYCLAHHAEDCDTTGGLCAVAMYAEEPRSPNVPASVRAARTVDIPSRHFVANTGCTGAQGTVSLGIDVYNATRTPPQNVSNVISPPPAPPPSPPRKCFKDFKRDSSNAAETERVWRAADWSVDPAGGRDAPEWCDKPQRLPYDLPDRVTLPSGDPLRIEWYEYAKGSAWPAGASFWSGTDHDESDWKTYWSSRLAGNQDWQAINNEDWLEGCQRPRPSDSWDIWAFAPAGSRWAEVPYALEWRGRSWQPSPGSEDLVTVGHPLVEEALEVCEGAAPRIVGVWGTHVGAANWIMGPSGDECEWRYDWQTNQATYHDKLCEYSHGAQFARVVGGKTVKHHLGDEWHRRLADVEPCVGEAECDAWAPPIPGWYQVRFDVVPPRAEMHEYSSIPKDRVDSSKDVPVSRMYCATVDPNDPTKCDAYATDRVMWNDPTPFVFDELIWVQGLDVNSG